MLNVASNRYDKILWTVFTLVIAIDRFTTHRFNGVRGSQDWFANRAVAKKGFRKYIMDKISGIIISHGDFLEDNSTFRIYVCLCYQRGGDHVGDNFNG